MSLTWMMEDLPIDPVILGIIACEKSIAHDRNDLETEGAFDWAIGIAVRALRPEIFECLKRAYGGDTGLYYRLCQTAEDDDAPDVDRDEPTPRNLMAYEFVKSGL
jgi:hypothetical protein